MSEAIEVATLVANVLIVLILGACLYLLRGQVDRERRRRRNERDVP